VVVVGGGQVAGYRVDTGAKVWWVGGLSIQPKASPVVAADGSVYVLAPGSGEGASGGIEPFAQLAAKLDKNGDGKLTTEELGSYNQADSDGDGVMTEREYRTFLSGGQIPSALLAIDPAGQGDRTASGVRWRYARGLPLVPSPLVYGGVLYLLKEGGILTALDPATGTVLKQARLLGALDAYFASPVGADGKLYCASQTGHVAVVRAGPELELLGVNDLDDECFATPAVAPGRLYVRTRRGLHCFGAQAQSAAPAALRAGR
jgi:outer membrane protein assembly factor BamB